MFADMPKAAIQPMLLHFTPTAALMTAAAREASKGAKPAGDAVFIGGDRGAIELSVMKGAFVTRMAGASPSKRDQEQVLDTYTDLDAGTVTETRNFMGRTFRLSEPQVKYRWKLTSEMSQFLGHPVMKATAEHDGERIEAWFTPDIPVSAGPAGFGGLPGLILTLTVNEGAIAYTATAVTLGEPGAQPVAPTDGKEVTPEEYDKIVADKLAELAKMGGQQRRRDF
jgi:GLPGLI family protein